MADRYTSTPGDQIRDDSIKTDELDITNTPTDGQIIKINMPTGDFTAIDFLPTDLNLSGQTAEDFAIFDGTNWVAQGGTERIYSDKFQRDMTTATGTQAVTGIGFKPTYVLMLASVGAGQTVSWGSDNSNGSRRCLYSLDGDITTITGAGTVSVQLYISGSAEQHGLISSFDSDGFTFSWTKVGSPTGTATVNFTAFR